MQARKLLAVLGTKDQEKRQPFRPAMNLGGTHDGKAGDIRYESASGPLASAWTPCRGAAKYHTVPHVDPCQDFAHKAPSKISPTWTGVRDAHGQQPEDKAAAQGQAGPTRDE